MIPYDHAMITTNGVRLHVVQAGPPEGKLMLMLHGFPEFWYGWRNQIDYFAAQGWRVWAPDQRGYNISEKPPGIAASRRYPSGILRSSDALAMSRPIMPCA